ncbi:TetR/AcrR family transcriptional regulator, partial [Listeria monocytogenes]|nr:TetR/AcrR family transcriptional regulator [Listeria monocytogenes]EAG7323622.1 TetR/AcrR family transcriptional regulator [Listeria monocytogenes]
IIFLLCNLKRGLHNPSLAIIKTS